MCREMQFAINRQVVLDGLNRRAEERAAAAREAELEAFEQAMIRRCNAQYDAANLQQRMDEDLRTSRERCASNISNRAAAKERRQSLHKDIAFACLIYFTYTVVLFWLTKWTHLPMWGAITYAVGGVAFLATHIQKLRGLFD